MIGYKLFKVRNGLLQSLAFRLPEELVVTYPVNEWVEAPLNTRLFLFKWKHAAIHWWNAQQNNTAHRPGLWQLWKIEAWHPRAKDTIFWVPGVPSVLGYQRWWDNLLPWDTSSAPYGTLVSKKIKLLERENNVLS